MLNNVTESRGDIAEKLYFNLFQVDKREEYKRMLLYITFNTIKSHGRITLNKLTWTLDTDYCFSNDDVQLAVKALLNPNMYGAISKFTLPAVDNRTKTVQLSVKNTDVIDGWIESVLVSNPELKTLAPKQVVQ